MSNFGRFVSARPSKRHRLVRLIIASVGNKHDRPRSQLQTVRRAPEPEMNDDDDSTDFLHYSIIQPGRGVSIGIGPPEPLRGREVKTAIVRTITELNREEEEMEEMEEMRIG